MIVTRPYGFATETYAVTHPTDRVHGVALFHQDVTREPDGNIIGCQEKSSEWLPSGADEWDLAAADNVLYSAGWLRSGSWTFRSDPIGGGRDGYQASVAKT